MSAATSSPSSPPSARPVDRAGFAVIATGLRQCITADDAGESDLDVAELEKLFLSLA